ncbi:glycosyltransferase [Streptomyces sp. NPDC046712]|uniref:glycosyltransferase n=1 Tax=Streptomyces sp. NPDC046712 TaxID=3154802 RepID=UPI0033C99344
MSVLDTSVPGGSNLGGKGGAKVPGGKGGGTNDARLSDLGAKGAGLDVRGEVLPGVDGPGLNTPELALGIRRPLRIVRLANFVTPTSGGLRTALEQLGRGYLAAGHEPVLIVPGDVGSDQVTDQGRVITLPGPVLPGTGGYRVLADRRRLRRLLEELAPDRLEVSDRTTLRWTGEWARRARVPSVMVSHETADGVLRTWGVPPAAAARAADRLNRRTAWAYSRIVCTTEWAEREFVRIGARNVVRAPLGVDLDRCRPGRRSTVLRAKHADGERVLLVMCSRLSVEKRPGTALDTLAHLRGAGVRAALVVAGDGPLRSTLERRARDERLPVRFLGHVANRETLADLQAAADLCLAPGPAETFGLSALEALACGTPVVASASSALPEVLGDAGACAPDDPAAFAASIRSLLDRPEQERRAAARARAELFGWDRSIAAFLQAHDAAPASILVPPQGART